MVTSSVLIQAGFMLLRLYFTVVKCLQVCVCFVLSSLMLKPKARTCWEKVKQKAKDIKKRGTGLQSGYCTKNEHNSAATEARER